MSTPAPETRRASEERPSLLTEGVILAASTAAAYAIAFAFESGHADCYGFPHWAIEVSLVNVILAWATIAVTTLVLALLFFFFGGLLPARAVRLLVFNRFTLLMAVGVATIFEGQHYGFAHNQAPLGWVLMVAGTLCIVFGLYRWIAYYRTTDRAKSFLDRVEAANRRAWEEDSSSPLVSDTILHRTIEHAHLGKLYAGLVVLSLVIVVGMGLARSFGRLQAATRFTYLVSNDSLAVVALRRYGDDVLVTRLAPRDSAGLRPISIMPWQSRDRSWTYRYLAPRSTGFRACRD